MSATVAGLAAPGLAVPAATIDYGDRLRVGVVLPSGNTTAEAEISAMLPTGVLFHVTRLPLVGSSPEQLAAMAAGVDEAAHLLADAHPDLVLFHCTAVTTTDPATAEALRLRLQERTGAPAVTTGGALVAALHHLRAQRVVVLTPYIDAVHQQEVAFLAAHDLEVVSDANLGIDGNAEMARLSPRSLARFVETHADPRADAYVLSCTALRSAPVVAELEAQLGRPVVTSNTAAVWHVLRSGGLDDATVDGYGQLLAEGPGTATAADGTGVPARAQPRHPGDELSA